MDIEEASNYIVKEVRERNMSEDDKKRMTQYLNKEKEKKFGVYSEKMLLNILHELE